MYQDIRTALILHYEALGLPVPVAQENAKNTHSEYIEIFYIPNTNNVASLGSEGIDRHVGLIQFNITVEAGTKSAKAFDYASQIVQHYQRGTVVSRNNYTAKITGATSSGGFTSENKYIVPVTVNWSSDIQRT